MTRLVLHRTAHRSELVPFEVKMQSKNDSALFIGRFQPFHNGHLGIVRKITSECAHVIIAIGSAQYFGTNDNPFSADERRKMIDSALKSEGIKNYSIVLVDDINEDSVWVSHVKSICNEFSIVYTNNKNTKKLFEVAGYNVRETEIYERKEYSGTEIRKRIANNQEWRSLVPPNVADVIDSIDGVQRVKTHSASDYDEI